MPGGYTVHCRLYTVHCRLYTVQCTVYSVHDQVTEIRDVPWSAVALGRPHGDWPQTHRVVGHSLTQSDSLAQSATVLQCHSLCPTGCVPGDSSLVTGCAEAHPVTRDESLGTHPVGHTIARQTTEEEKYNMYVLEKTFIRI